ncbi:hypothetical protein Ahy_B05g079470 [Arachis hypogaea]|uniref:SWIM-type domain-containing protein n=1 Tax=Arachis hypogaea TaxID=3818 RepID=A0A444Z9X2_ARAHY|nr:hypothetical protein Ahy_B05g079470 [Arachis hypogaea]
MTLLQEGRSYQTSTPWVLLVLLRFSVVTQIGEGRNVLIGHWKSGKEGAKLPREPPDTEIEKLLDIMFHHGGTFKKNDDGKLVYSPDNRSCLGDLDKDTLDVFFVRNYFKELGYAKVVECWWLVPGRSLEVELRALTSDDELREMCFHAERNNGVVDVYFEHGVFTPELMDGKGVVMLLDYEAEETNKETVVDTSNQTPDDKSATNPTPNLSTANTIPSTATPIPNHPAADPLTTNPTNEPNPMDEPDNPKPNYTPNPKSSTKPNPAPIVKHNHKPTPKPKNLLKPNKTQSKPKSKFTSKPKPKFNPPKRITRFQAKGRSTNKGKQPLHMDLTVNGSTSDDGSLEDTSYVPVQEASSSNDEELVARVSKPIRKEVKKVQKKTGKAKGKEKIGKDKIMQDDDAIVEDYSDVEVDIGFKGTPGEGIWYEALDPGAESDGANSNPIWIGDQEYEKFEVYGHPTNMVVDLGKRLCTCQFWMLTGIPCVHACAALARVNKRPEDFCHPLVTMDSYRKTYEHHINPLPGQSLWEKSVYNQPQAPNIKRKPGKLTTKRRKDADEARQLKPFTCTYCGIKGHTKKGCKKKRADELAAAATAVAAAKSKIVPAGNTPAAEAMNTTNVAPQVDETPLGGTQVDEATEIDLSQPNYGGTQYEAPPPPTTTKRPDKLLTKRRNSPTPVIASVNPMQGASAATSSRLANFLKFVPTPGFKPPKKKNTNYKHLNLELLLYSFLVPYYSVYQLLQNCHYHLLQRLPIGKTHTTVFHYTKQHLLDSNSHCNSDIRRMACPGGSPLQTIGAQGVSYTHSALALVRLCYDQTSLSSIA